MMPWTARSPEAADLVLSHVKTYKYAPVLIYPIMWAPKRSWQDVEPYICVHAWAVSMYRFTNMAVSMCKRTNIAIAMFIVHAAAISWLSEVSLLIQLSIKEHTNLRSLLQQVGCRSKYSNRCLEDICKHVLKKQRRPALWLYDCFVNIYWHIHTHIHL